MLRLKIFGRKKSLTGSKPWVEVSSNKIEYRSHRKLFSDNPVPFEQSPQFALQLLYKPFLRMRIYYSIKFANQIFSTAKSKKNFGIIDANS